jgi:hypothetical protein
MGILSLANFAVFMITILVSEIYIAQAGYPQSEEHMNVGQWALFVTLALGLYILAVTEIHEYNKLVT